MTPGGKLQAGDRIRRLGTSEVYKVLERLGNDEGYAVRLQGENTPKKDPWIMCTAAWAIRPNGEYEVLK